MKKYQELGLFVSSFIPLYLLIMCKILLEIINGNLSFNTLNTAMLCFLLLLSIFGIIVLVDCLKKCKHNAKQTITIISKTNSTDQYFLGYFSLFVLFAISFEIEMMSMAFVFIFVLVFIGIVYIKNDLYYVNPLLNILGYSFYDIQYKTEDDEQIKQARVFFNGKLDIGREYRVNFKNPNFCFVKKHK